jgi:hypothetical protein
MHLQILQRLNCLEGARRSMPKYFQDLNLRDKYGFKSIVAICCTIRLTIYLEWRTLANIVLDRAGAIATFGIFDTSVAAKSGFCFWWTSTFGGRDELLD